MADGLLYTVEQYRSSSDASLLFNNFVNKTVNYFILRWLNGGFDVSN